MPRMCEDDPPEYVISDEAAAYIADALMNLALQFEATHFAEIHRHYDALAPRNSHDPGNSTCSASIRRFERKKPPPVIAVRPHPSSWSLPCRVHSLVRPAPRAFFRPDRQISQPPRAGPVKAGRGFAATRRAWP
jgi:hypothetical protein